MKWEEYGVNMFKIPSEQFPGGTEENNDIIQVGQAASEPRIEPGTSRIQHGSRLYHPGQTISFQDLSYVA
jgi:hypothetical protein